MGVWWAMPHPQSAVLRHWMGRGAAIASTRTPSLCYYSSPDAGTPGTARIQPRTHIHTSQNNRIARSKLTPPHHPPPPIPAHTPPGRMLYHLRDFMGGGKAPDESSKKVEEESKAAASSPRPRNEPCICIALYAPVW